MFMCDMSEESILAKITTLILAKNEERNIVDCIKTVQFTDEILVIDDFSTDCSKSLAESMGGRVIQHAMNGDWGGQQTFAIQNAKCEWVLFLDADERISESLAKEIREVVENNEQKSYWIRRENQFRHYRATHGTLRPDYVDRLFPAKDSYVEGYVHPKIVTPYPNEKLKNIMYHYTYDTWDQQLNKLNNNTRFAALKYKDKGKKCNFLLDIMLRPLWAFLKVYIINKGFLDGKMGWILATNHYFYTMNKYVKLYFLYRDPDGRL